MRTRRAVTLIEMLIVVAITGTLMALLLPAVQQVRGAANRARCASNLRQLGIALHNYHAENGHLPAGRGAPTPKTFSAHARLLPYLEQANLSFRIDYDAPPTTFSVGSTLYDGTANYPAATTRVSILLCPSDAANGLIPGSAYGPTNYAGNAGSDAASGNLGSPDGVFGTGVEIRLEDVADGTASTAAFGERLLGQGSAVGPSDAGDPTRDVREISGSADTTTAACDPASGGAWNHERGAKWILGNYGNTLYNHALPPNSRTPDCMNATQQKGRLTARSNHANGVNLLLCDGSLQFVSSSIAFAQWRALATRAGGD